MFVRSKTHQTLKQEHQDLLVLHSRQIDLLDTAHQIFASIPASRLSQGVKEQIAQWQKDVTDLTGDLLDRREKGI